MLPMKKVILAACVAAGMVLTAGAGTALADGPATHIKSTFSGEILQPAGTLCDFTYDVKFTVDVNFIIAPNGENPVLLTQYNTHTNLDTGYSLTEVDQVNEVAQPHSSTAMQVGIFWHLRDASGQVVLVKAGEATLDAATGQLISFTPNSGFDQTYAQIICPALGGNPV
jgi:hypothetical protein